jgi:hypothetical protein
VGFIVAFLAGREEEAAEYIIRPDIVNRIGRANIHDLKYLQEPLDVEAFMTGLFELVVDSAKREAAEQAGEIPPDLRWYAKFDSGLDDDLIGTC